jgi:hypothetical protein
MKLRRWLFERRLKITDFAKLMKTGRCYVHHWMAGVKPSEEVLSRVKEITQGEVSTFDDLIDERVADTRQRR